MSKTFSVSFYSKRNTLTGCDLVTANSLTEAKKIAQSMCARHEHVGYIREAISPNYVEDKDLLDYDSIEVI